MASTANVWNGKIAVKIICYKDNCSKNYGNYINQDHCKAEGWKKDWRHNQRIWECPECRHQAHNTGT